MRPRWSLISTLGDVDLRVCISLADHHRRFSGRTEKIKDLEDKVALAEAAKLLPGGLADQPAVGSSRSAELPAGVAKVEEGGGLLLSGSFPGGDSAGANEVELLERVVARMKEKLVQLGVGEDEIQQLMVQAGEGGGTGGSELGWIASSASPAPETNRQSTISRRR